MHPDAISISDDQMKQLEERLTKSIQIIVQTTIIEEMKKLRVELEQSKQLVHQLENNNIELTKQVQDLQQYIRRENLTITNYPEHANEKIENIISQIGEKIGVPINFKCDIQAAHRIPSKAAVKPIVVRFTNRQVRNEFMKAAKNKKVQVRDARVYFNDHLTPTNDKIFYEARKLVKAKQIKAAWTYAGNIYVKRTESSDGVKIQHMNDLKPFQVPYASVVQESG